MRRVLILAILLGTPIMGIAQEVKPMNDYKGFYIDFSLMSSTWTMPDTDNIKPSTGFGVGAAFAYSFSPYFGLILPFSVSSFNPDRGADYGMFDIAIGGEIRPVKASSSVKPYGRLAYGSMWLYSNLTTGDITIVSYGLSTDLGLQIELSEELNLKLGYRQYWGDVTTVIIGSNEYDADGDIGTRQVSVGLVRYF